MVIKTGRFGKFLACPGFPECRNTKPLVESIGVKCPQCRHGEVIMRKSKKGSIFYGCSAYPDCSFVSWDKPIGVFCPKCSGYLIEKQNKKETKILCTAKNCDYIQLKGDGEGVH